MRRLRLWLGTLGAMLSLLTVPALNVSAATVEDVYSAMEAIGMPAAFIQDTRNQFPNTVHDDDGMELNGEYHTYADWAVLIRGNGMDYVFGVIAEEFCVDKDALVEYYMNLNQTTAPSADEPSQTTTTTAVTTPDGKTFADMTPDEKHAYIMSLPEDERIAFLASLSPAERNDLLKHMDQSKLQGVMQGMADIASQMGMHVTVDSAGDGSLSFSVRDDAGNLMDSTSLGLRVDATGWNTTLPVLGASAVMLGAVGGLIYLSLRCKNQEE